MKQVATFGGTGGTVKEKVPRAPGSGISRHQPSVTRQLKKPKARASAGASTGRKLSWRVSHGP